MSLDETVEEDDLNDLLAVFGCHSSAVSLSITISLHCFCFFQKTPHFRHSVKNKVILVIFGTQNPEDILETLSP